MATVSSAIGDLRNALSAKFYEQNVLDVGECLRLRRMAAARAHGLDPMDFNKSTLGPLVNAETHNYQFPAPPAAAPPAAQPPATNTPAPASTQPAKTSSPLLPIALAIAGVLGAGGIGGVATWLLTRNPTPAVATPAPAPAPAPASAPAVDAGVDYWYQPGGPGTPWIKVPVVDKPPTK